MYVCSLSAIMLYKPCLTRVLPLYMCPRLYKPGKIYDLQLGGKRKAPRSNSGTKSGSAAGVAMGSSSAAKKRKKKARHERAEEHTAGQG